MDNELFDLCKEVYKRTGWTDTDYYWHEDGKVLYTPAHSEVKKFSYYVCPLYTSDYLLERLPGKIKGKHSTGWLTLSPMDKETWSAGYEADHTEHIDDYKFEWSDTPLKALLKLTIALSEAGELK